MSCLEPCLLLKVMRYFYQLYINKLYVSIIFYWEGSAKTHIYIDICMRVNIKIPATIITDASSCSFPLVILQEMDGQMERGLLLVCPTGHHGIPSPLKGPLTSHGVWFIRRLQLNYKLVLNISIKTWFQESVFFSDTLLNFKATIPSEQCKKYTKGDYCLQYGLDTEVTVLYITNHHPGNPSSRLL